MTDEVKDLMYHRLTAVEEKIDDLSGGMTRLLLLEDRHLQTRRDMDVAFELMRVNSTSQATFQAQITLMNSRIEHLIGESVKFNIALSDPDRGISVRMAKAEGIQDTNRHAIRYISVTMATCMIGALAFVFKWAWTATVGKAVAP